MPKVLKTIFAVLFILCLIIPGVFFFTAVTKEDFPKFAEDGKLNTSFSDDMDEYFSDILPIKEYFISENNFVKEKILRSETSNVITGRNSYLFYSETRNDYLGVETLSGREIFSIAETINLISNYCENSGIEFVFAAVPNKNSILTDSMPYNFINRSSKNLTLLQNELSERGVNTADIYSSFSDNENKDSLYYKTDTHWNQYGAYIGYSEIINAFSADVPEEIKDLALSDFEFSKARKTDLTSLLFSPFDIEEEGLTLKTYSSLLDDIKINLRGADTNDTEKLMDEINDKDENFSIINTSSKIDSAGGSLYILRDSFCRAMLPYLACTFNTAEFVKSSTINTYVYDLSEFDALLYEIVERNLKDILSDEMLMPAPEVDIDVNSAEADKGTVDINTDYEDYIMISGEINNAVINNDSRFYVRITDHKTNESIVYEAFPGEVGSSAQSYYLTIPRDQISSSSIELICDSAVIAKTELSF